VTFHAARQAQEYTRDQVARRARLIARRECPTPARAEVERATLAEFDARPDGRRALAFALALSLALGNSNEY
jgi:hypothetical protein